MKTLKLIKNDPWLAPYKQAIEGRHNRAVEKISELTGGTGNLSDFADGYLYFGLHKTATGYFGSGRPMPMLSI